jgi:hypothetical protein
MKHLNLLCSNRLARTCSKAPAIMLQHRRMQPLKEVVIAELVSSVV